MRAMKKFLAITACFTICCAICFVEEQSTTPQRAYNVISGVQSYRSCELYCWDDQQCQSVSYSDALRICHLQVPADQLLWCNVPPFRRFVKTDQNCVGQEPGVTYARSNLSLEHGVDPYVPMALLHPESPPSLNGMPPVCLVRKLDGSEGPLLYLRGLDSNGDYTSLGISDNVYMSIDAEFNFFRVDYISDADWVVFSFISGFCAEENPGDECRPPLPPFTTSAITGSATPMISGQGACPGQQLHATVYLHAAPFTFNGNDAKLFCAGGFWLAGDYNHGADGHTYRLETASCGD